MHDDQHGTAIVVLATVSAAGSEPGHDPTAGSSSPALSAAGGRQHPAGISARDVVVLDSRASCATGAPTSNSVKADWPRAQRRLTGGLMKTLVSADVFLRCLRGRLVPEDYSRHHGAGPSCSRWQPTRTRVHPDVAHHRLGDDHQAQRLLARSTACSPSRGVAHGALDINARPITSG